MKLIMNAIDGHYLRDLLEEAKSSTDRIDAAVAYATRDDLLFDWCWDNSFPIRFWGRFDQTVPVSPDVLQTFVDRRSARYVCKLVRHFHPKVIWWRGFGAYIGSANLTQTAWFNNVETGVFLTDDEIAAGGFDLHLEQFFHSIDSVSSPVSQETVDLMRARQKVLNKIGADDKAGADAFLANGLVQPWTGLVQTSKRSASDKIRDRFLKEWYETLEILRGIAAKVSVTRNRPGWVSETAPSGAQADQFLHAYYYARVRGKARYEDLFQKHRDDPDSAVADAVGWWTSLDQAPTIEDETLNRWAPYLREMFAPEKLLQLTRVEFREVLSHIHASLEYARRVQADKVDLPEGTYQREEKINALADKLYGKMTPNGPHVLQTLNYVLHGGPSAEVPLRIWNALNDPTRRVAMLGVSSLGEIVGWALPEQFPPRNGRTSKALRALGFDVTVHTGA